MKTKKRRAFSKVVLLMLLVLASLFVSACFFDTDEAIDLKDSISKQIVVQEDSTLFYFYYDSQEHPIEDYKIIRVNIDYYVDYKSRMKKEEFFLFVPDDIQYEDQTYFTVEIEDALTDESVVYVSVLANYKAESSSRVWLYVFAVLIALALLIILCAAYTALCDANGSNTPLPSFMWLMGLIIFIVVAVVVSSKWGNGPGSIILSGGILYFLFTLIPYFQNRT